MFLLLAWFHHSDWGQGLNVPVYDFFMKMSVDETWLKIWFGITQVGAGWWIYSVIFLVCAFGVWNRQLKFSWRSLAVLVGLCLVNPALKLVFASARPVTFAPHLLDPQTYSFPSGHTVNAVILFFFLPALLNHVFPASQSRYRKLQALLASVGVLFIGSSRLALGVHWLTDVLAGVCVGAGVVLLMKHEIQRSHF